LKLTRHSLEGREMTVLSVIQELSRDEVRRVVGRETGRELSIKQFYQWLPYCLIQEPKDFYSVRELQKFLFVARILNRVRKLETARQQLINAMHTQPEQFNHDFY
jgi:hypothetical protein